MIVENQDIRKRRLYDLKQILLRKQNPGRVSFFIDLNIFIRHKFTVYEKKKGVAMPRWIM